MAKSRLSAAEKWILWGIPILFLIGAGLHFVFELSGNSPLVGALAPVNESVWEHLKMIVLPLILWWTLYYVFAGKHQQLDVNRWFTAQLVSLLTSLLTIPLLYYFYTNAFAVESVWVDSALLLLALLFGQLLGLHVYRHCKGIPYPLALFLTLVILMLFIWWTFLPPKLPIFEDPLKGFYGLPK